LGQDVLRGGPTFGIAHGGDHAARLVQNAVARSLWLNTATVDLDLLTSRVDLDAELADHDAVDANTPRRDQEFGLAPCRQARTCEHLLQSFESHLASVIAGCWADPRFPAPEAGGAAYSSAAPPGAAGAPALGGSGGVVPSAEPVGAPSAAEPEGAASCSMLYHSSTCPERSRSTPIRSSLPSRYISKVSSLPSPSVSRWMRTMRPSR